MKLNLEEKYLKPKLLFKKRIKQRKMYKRSTNKFSLEIFIKTKKKKKQLNVQCEFLKLEKVKIF